MRFKLYRILFASVFPVNNFFVFPAFFLCLLAGDANIRKNILWQEFEWAHMQSLPASAANYHRLKEFDIVFQQLSGSGPETGYPHSYIIGLYKPSLGRFERTHLLSRVNPFKEYALVKAVSDHYQTDSTYLDALIRDRKNKLESVVYRKTRRDAILDSTASGSYTEADREEYVMWKKERVVLTDGHLTTRLLEKWNKERFE
jgi:hypothetical protein